MTEKRNKFLLLKCSLLMQGVPEPENWEDIFRYLEKLHHSLYWWIGDSFRFGEAQLGDVIYQYVSEHFSPGLIERCVRVAREFPVDQRFETLSWTHHYSALTLQPPLRKSVLSLAEKNHWDTAELKRYIRKLRES